MFWIVLGVGIFVFIAFLAAAGFAGYSKVIKRVKEKQAQKELTTQVEKIQREQSRAMRKEYDNTGRITGSGLQGADKMLDVLETAGKGASEDAVTTRAAATWFKNISDAAKHVEKMTRPLGPSVIMDAEKLKGAEGLASYRGFINQTILENQSLLDQFENTETNFKELLLLEGLAPSKATVLAKQFAGTIKEGMPFIRKIRNAEIQRMTGQRWMCHRHPALPPRVDLGPPVNCHLSFPEMHPHSTLPC